MQKRRRKEEGRAEIQRKEEVQIGQEVQKTQGQEAIFVRSLEEEKTPGEKTLI